MLHCPPVSTMAEQMQQHFPVPTISKFIESLDREKKEQDNKLDVEEKAKRAAPRWHRSRCSRA
jgi:hypothetical protein